MPAVHVQLWLLRLLRLAVSPLLLGRCHLYCVLCWHVGGFLEFGSCDWRGHAHSVYVVCDMFAFLLSRHPGVNCRATAVVLSADSKGTCVCFQLWVCNLPTPMGTWLPAPATLFLLVPSQCRCKAVSGPFTHIQPYEKPIYQPEHSLRTYLCLQSSRV